MNWAGIKTKVRAFFQDVQIINRNKATELLEFEVLELRNIFALLLFGSFVGMPAPPVHITLQLLPLMDTEVQIMLRRINVAHDALAELVSTLGEP
jgi:predicted Kef-type K+ transport protein